jgi:fermentation-respiration switch protein FrsA (DUF1100 family)
MRLLLLLLALPLALYVAAGMVLIGYERKLVYRAGRENFEPAQVGLSARVLSIPTNDGERIVGWFAAAGPNAPLALFLHGNGGSLADRAPQIRQLAAWGFSVLAIDYRGFGGSTGSPSEAGLIEDGEAALRQAAALGFPISRILLVGQSLGSGVATALAARRAFAGLLLDSPFSSLVDVAADRYPAFPVRWLMRDTFRSDLRIGDNRAPLMVLLGESDEVTPARFGRKLFELAPAPKSLAVTSGGHMALCDPRVARALKEWLSGLGL